MSKASLPAERLLDQCLAWLDAQAEADLPVLLLSAGPPRDHARYHVLARRPRCVVQGHGPGSGGSLRVHDATGRPVDEAPWEELLPLLRRLERDLARPPRRAEGPFRGGWIGCFGYDLAWLFEYGLPRFLPATSPLPDLWLGWYDDPIVCDRSEGSVWGEDLATLLDRGSAMPPSPVRVLGVEGPFHREEYEAAVERVREHCLRGDIFQTNLSRRIALRVDGSPGDLFKRLVVASPAPFMAYLGLGDGRAVVSASPEEYVRLTGGALRTRPIKGTRPRGEGAASDERQRTALLASEKDLAELTMIVDLMRNDLGRVARPGSVVVREFPVLLTLPQVHHLYATIEAQLAEGHDFWDVLAASFPPGSISGAPKPKAIEILELVERSRRGIYTGAIGYVEPGGNAHLNVAIRTAEWSRGLLRFGVGGGITALSDASLEFEETLDKARGLAAALGIGDL